MITSPPPISLYHMVAFTVPLILVHIKNYNHYKKNHIMKTILEPYHKN